MNKDKKNQRDLREDAKFGPNLAWFWAILANNFFFEKFNSIFFLRFSDLIFFFKKFFGKAFPN